MSTLRFGLTDKVLRTVRDILVSCPEVETALIYGSRAMGTQHVGSDIDLTLLGPALNERHLSAISTQLDESDIPYLVDLSLHKDIDNPGLLAHIERVGRVFYAKPSLGCPP